MPRGYIVKGQPGVLVGHPRQLTAPDRAERGFLGKLLKSPEELAALAAELGLGSAAELELPERYRDVEEFCDHPDMARVVEKNPGLVIAGPIVSRGRLNLESAKALVAKLSPAKAEPKASAKAEKAGDK